MTTTQTAETSRTSKPANGAVVKKDGTARKTPVHRELSPVERSTRAVMNLVGRLEPGDQRKVIAAVTVLVSKAD